MSTIWLIFDSHSGLLALCILGLKLSEYLDKLACFFKKIFTVDAYSTFHNRDAKCSAICFFKKFCQKVHRNLFYVDGPKSTKKCRSVVAMINCLTFLSSCAL